MQEAKAGVTLVFKAMYMCPWEEEGGNSYVNVTFKDASNFSYNVYRGWAPEMESEMVEDVYSGTYALAPDGNITFTANQKLDARNDATVTQFETPLVWEGRVIADNAVQVGGAVPRPPWDDPATSKLFPYVCTFLNEDD